VLQGLCELDELGHRKLLGAGLFIESEVSKDAGQCRSGQCLRKGSQEIGTQRLAPMREGRLDKAKQPTYIARWPG
jgi:hypothetical protein